MINTFTLFNNKTIYFEGVDFSGKSTVIHDLLPSAISNSSFLCDRSIVSSIVYSKYFKRQNVDIFYLDKEFQRSMNLNKSFMFFINPDYEVIKERIEGKKREEKWIDLADIPKIKEAYEKFFKKYEYYANIVHIKSSNPQEEILNYEMELSNKHLFNNDLEFDYFILYNTLTKKQNSELNDYNLYYSFKNLDDFAQKFGINAHTYESITDITYSQVYKIYDNEIYERNKILSDLQFNTHIQVDKYKENIYSRRFLAINDSCFSFVQVIIRNDTIYFNFNFRSSEISKYLCSDLLFVKRLVIDYLRWFKKYINFNQEIPIFQKSINIHIILNSAHLLLGK